MNSSSIRKYLKEHSIYSKRKTTIAHAFASAIAPSDTYNQDAVKAALQLLGQADLDRLLCVYCNQEAQTWDHLVGLVENGDLNTRGYGHQIGNLVPCCKDCNSSKAGKPFPEFIQSLPLSASEKLRLDRRLNAHLKNAKPFNVDNLDPASTKAFAKLIEIREEIFQLMRDADECAQVIRGRRVSPGDVE
ncbi:MAG: HNH endonuclease [Calditrichaeota bacterium]|nr:HNH endonuclease [Calditrichota bacterium]